MPSRSELIASNNDVEKIRGYLGVESLEYLTMDDLRSVVKDPENFCYACFSGDYPVPIASEELNKSVFEDSPVGA
jgi:amidophosphoribosyltransferase